MTAPVFARKFLVTETDLKAAGFLTEFALSRRVIPSWAGSTLAALLGSLLPSVSEPP